MVNDKEVLRCGLNKDKSRVAEQADSTDELSPLQGDEGSIEDEAEATLPQTLERDFCNWEITGSSLGRSFFS